MLTLFFSYSHRDQSLRDELEIHLAMLKREGTISTWHDGRIVAGQDFDDSIKERLESADIVLLLISPYFLNSAYCYDIELKHAMERHDTNEAHVIPVILEPCDWHHAPFGRLRATPRDGKPISKFTNLNDGFLEVVQDVRRSAQELLRTRGQTHTLATPVTLRAHPAGGPRTSNLRIKKTFTDKEKDDFLDDAFEYIARFYENSLAELRERNPGVETKFKRIDATHFDAAIYRQGKRETQCRIWRASGRGFVNGIAYSTNPLPGDNSFNDTLGVQDDGYTIGLRPQMYGVRGQKLDHLTQEGGAEYLWNILMESLR